MRTVALSAFIVFFVLGSARAGGGSGGPGIVDTTAVTESGSEQNIRSVIVEDVTDQAWNSAKNAYTIYATLTDLKGYVAESTYIPIARELDVYPEQGQSGVPENVKFSLDQLPLWAKALVMPLKARAPTKLPSQTKSEDDAAGGSGGESW